MPIVNPTPISATNPVLTCKTVVNNDNLFVKVNQGMNLTISIVDAVSMNQISNISWSVNSIFVLREIPDIIMLIWHGSICIPKYF